MRVQVGVKGIVRHPERADHFLVVRRVEPLPDGRRNVWDILGGRQQPGEEGKPLVTLDREAHEEVPGLSIVDAVPFDMQVFEPKPELTVVRLTYLCRAAGDLALLDLGPEHDMGFWAPTDAILGLKLDDMARKSFEKLHAQSAS